MKVWAAPAWKFVLQRVNAAPPPGDFLILGFRPRGLPSRGENDWTFQIRHSQEHIFTPSHFFWLFLALASDFSVIFAENPSISPPRWGLLVPLWNQAYFGISTYLFIILYCFLRLCFNAEIRGEFKNGLRFIRIFPNFIRFFFDDTTRFYFFMLFKYFFSHPFAPKNRGRLQIPVCTYSAALQPITGAKSRIRSAASFWVKQYANCRYKRVFLRVFR